MQTCTRVGCGRSFDPADNTAADCTFHPGAPLFHEGLKSYTCCNDTNKPVLSFDEFLAISGCTTGSHSSEKSEVKQPVVTAKVDGKGSAVDLSSPVTAINQAATSTSSSVDQQKQWRQRPPAAQTEGVAMPAAMLQDEDPEDCVISTGSACKRTSCNVVYQEGLARSSEECKYHPLPAVFHEGSKGYACCKRKVLEFDEFLRIEGCTQGRHCFIGSASQLLGQDQQVDCRHDMYQTPTQVICSVFGKQASKESSLNFDEWTIAVDLRLPGSKRFTKTFELYGPIDPDKSSYKIMGTKVEMILYKADGRSWPSLEAPRGTVAPAGKYGAPSITFGVSGRTGTVGAKNMIYTGDVVH